MILRTLCISLLLGLTTMGSAQQDSLILLSRDTIYTVNPNTGQDTMIVVEMMGEYRPDTVRIIGVGDIMLGTRFPGNGKYLPPEGAYPLLQPAMRVLQSAHLTFGNMEGAVTDEAPLEKKCKDTTICYAFQMPTRYVEVLDMAGFDVMSLANNHAFDFGWEGVKDAANTFDRYGIHYAGPQKMPWDTFSIQGITYGFAAFAPNRGCMHLLNLKVAKATITHLDTLADIVVVSFHGGAEGDEHQHVTGEPEFYYGENRGNVQAFSRAMVDAGADVIFGHGPHVVRALELYKNRLIAYSLGNFATYARFNLSGVNGYAPALEVHTTQEGAFIRAQVHSFLQRGEGGPYPIQMGMPLRVWLH